MVHEVTLLPYGGCHQGLIETLRSITRTWLKLTGSKNTKMITTAHDRDVNESRPCSRRTRWTAFSRCQQTVSISTYFSYKNTVNWHFFFVYRKFYHPGCIRHFFLYFLVRLTHISEQTRQDSSHGLKHQTAVSRFLRCSFSELRLKNKYWFVV